MISHWTGGRWKSPVHRVAQYPKTSSSSSSSSVSLSSSSPRLSLVYFTGPRSDVIVEPLNGEGEKIEAGEYARRKLFAGNWKKGEDKKLQNR